MPHFEKQLASETVFEGKVIRVTVDTVELENNATSTREVVHHGGGAGVLAIDENQEIYLVKQFRYALGKELIEIPAGKLEPGEDPFETAKRELAEEAGIVANGYKDLGTVIPTCGYCNEIIYLYAAKDLSFTQQSPDEDEFVSVFKIPLDEAVQMVLNAQINDSKTVSAILQLKLLIDAGAF